MVHEKWHILDAKFIFFQLLWVKENLQESWTMAFRWMDLSDWLAYRYSRSSCHFLLYEHSCLGIFLCESEDDKLFVAFSLVSVFCLEQQEMILAVCAPQCANGHTLVMHICNRSMRKILEIWKLVDGMMTFGKRSA